MLTECLSARALRLDRAAQDGVEQQQQRGRVGHGHVLRQELGGHASPRALAQHLTAVGGEARDKKTRFNLK